MTVVIPDIPNEQIGTVTTTGGGGGPVTAVSGAFVAGAITDLATLLTEFAELLTDTDNLATIAGAITANKMQQVQILGSAVLSDTNPEPNISNIQQMILNGKGYSCSTGLVTAAANEACSFFIPNTNAKNILIWSVRLMYSNASQTTDMRLITADDTNITGGTSDAGNVTNLKVGGSASGSSFAMHHASAVTAPASGASTLPLDEILNPVNATVECLAPGMFIYVPPSTAGGVSLYSATTAAGKWQVVIRWVEY